MSSSELQLYRLIERLCGAWESGNPATIKTTVSAVRREAKIAITREAALKNHNARKSKNAETEAL